MRKFGYEGRFNEHKQYADSKKASLLGKAMTELGKEAFYVELLEECDLECIDDRERYWIDTLGTLYPNGYNALYGAPYAHSEEAKRKISEGMKAFFASAGIRKIYSQSHLNKFKDISVDGIQQIRIHPIRQGGAERIVYMYITYTDGSQTRRRYGGAHEAYEEAFQRCYNDATVILQGDVQRIITPDRVQACLTTMNGEEVKAVEIKLHKMKAHQLVAVYITTNECTSAKEKKRHVFGGKTVPVRDAYNRAMEFVNQLKTPNTRVYTQESLIAATLSN